MQQTCTKNNTGVGMTGKDKGYPLGIVQETKVCPYLQMIYSQTRICL